MVEVHETVNNIKDNRRDKTYKIGSKQIDAVMVTDGLMQAITESKLIDFNKIINTDYRGFLVDIDIKEYFSVDSSIYDKAQHITLDLNRRSYWEGF